MDEAEKIKDDAYIEAARIIAEANARGQKDQPFSVFRTELTILPSVVNTSLEAKTFGTNFPSNG